MKREDVTIEGPVKDFTFTVDAGYESRRPLVGDLSRYYGEHLVGQTSSALGPEIQGVKTGVLDDFVTIPIGAEVPARRIVFVKDRCAALKALDGVDQFETLPGKPRVISSPLITRFLGPF
ncbi:hypothetical protein BD779DRAFT_1794307 [Infundibulicybe gibba]|nr:hypothetical protein BD779DRAFT_1794307 [Infundibulicybe gibba]